MKTLPIALSALLLSGCAGTRPAERYARQLRGVLATYQKEVERKVKAEQDSYRNLAPLYESARTTQTLNMLAQERLERAAALTDDILARARRGATLSPSELRALLRDYGTLDFSMTEDILAREMDAAGKRLADLETLDAQIQQVSVLDGVLADLSQPKGAMAKLKDAGTFVQSAKSCLDQRICAALKTELDALQAQLKSATSDADKKSLGQRIQDVQNAQKSHDCASSPKCP